MKRFIQSVSSDEEWDSDLVLCGIIAGLLILLVLQIYAVFWIKQPFDPSGFGQGIATILGVGGFGYAAKRCAEKGWFRYGNDSNSGFYQEGMGSSPVDFGGIPPDWPLRSRGSGEESLSENERGAARADF